MTSTAVLAAIDELKGERARIQQTIDALEHYAGIGNGTAPASGSLVCPDCQKSFKSAGGLGVHRARKHG